jgi:Mitochondrial ribosomal protein L37
MRFLSKGNIKCILDNILNRCSLSLSFPGHQTRGLAKAPKKEKGAKGEETTAPAVTTAGIIPINYLKDGTDPVAKPNDYYPDWLRDLSVSCRSSPAFALRLLACNCHIVA